VKSEGLADHTSTSGWTSPSGLQPTASTSAGPTIAECWVAINDYLTKFNGSQNNFTFLISHDETALTFSGLLDDYPGAAAAYSLRLLDKDYTGDAVRVRRASDNTEQDIGFTTDGDFDTTALATFCSGTNGFVKTWYDQSGNGNDATQTTTADQPKIYDSSTGVVTENGMPAVEFDGTSDFLETSTVTSSSQPISVISVTSADTIHSGGILNTTDTDNFIDFYRSDQGFAINAITTLTSSGSFNYSLATQYLKFSVFDGSSSHIYVNNTNSLTGNANTNGISGAFYLGKFLTSTDNFLDGKAQEIIVYYSDEDGAGNRTGIETNINDYYTIY